MRVGRTIERLKRRLLKRIYGFDRWHVGHADELYVADLVRHLNELPDRDRQAVAEIGCGLGDILRHLNFRTRLGLDRDPGVLAAARLLTRLQTAPPRFELFDFPRARLTGTYNVIIMVNWIHQVDPEQLRTAVHSFFAQHLHPGGRVVLDTVDDPAYKYNHDIHVLAPPGAMIDHLGQYPRGRHVWVVR